MFVTPESLFHGLSLPRGCGSGVGPLVPDPTSLTHVVLDGEAGARLEVSHIAEPLVKRHALKPGTTMIVPSVTRLLVD